MVMARYDCEALCWKGHSGAPGSGTEDRRPQARLGEILRVGDPQLNWFMSEASPELKSQMSLDIIVIHYH